MILRLMKSDRARPRPEVDGAPRSARASTRSSTTSSRPRTSARLARIYRGHPFIVIPDVVTSLSRERVIVSEFVAGRGFEEMKQLPAGGARPHRRDRSSASTSAACTATTSSRGDPHPGNCLLLDDGRMAFLDFGLFKRDHREGGRVRARRPSALGIERRGERAHRAPARRRLHRRPDATTTEAGHPRAVRRLHVVVHARRGGPSSTPEIATEVMIQMCDPRSRALRQDAPRDAAARPPLRPPPRRC